MSRYVKDPSFFRAVYVDHMDAAKQSGELINKSVKTRGRYAMEFDDMLNQVKADAWDEGAETAWKATGDGHNGEYAHPFGTHDGTAPFQLANPNTPNPYRKEQDDE